MVCAKIVQFQAQSRRKGHPLRALCNAEMGDLGHIPFGTRRILPLTALKSPDGGRHHGGLFALSGTKSDTRLEPVLGRAKPDPRARNLSVDTA